MNFGVCEHNTGERGVFNGELGLATLARNAADGAGQMLAVQSFD